MGRLVQALLGFRPGAVPTSAVGAAMVCQAMLEAFVPSAPGASDRERVVKRFLLARSPGGVCLLEGMLRIDLASQHEQYRDGAAPHPVTSSSDGGRWLVQV